MAPDIIQIGFSDSLGMFEPIFTDFGFFRFRIPPSYPQNLSEISIKIWAPERAPQGPLRGGSGSRLDVAQNSAGYHPNVFL